MVQTSNKSIITNVVTQMVTCYDTWLRASKKHEGTALKKKNTDLSHNKPERFLIMKKNIKTCQLNQENF